MAKYKTGLGSLCKEGHNSDGGYSLRYLIDGLPIGNCVQCGREANARRKEKQRAKRKKLAIKQGRDDGKYEGPVCRKGHGGKKSERYILDGSCVECDCERRRHRRSRPKNRKKDLARKHVENRERAMHGFDIDLALERAKTFELESQRRQLLRMIKKDGKKNQNN